MKKIRFEGLEINALERADVDKLLRTLEGERLVIPDEIDGIKVDALASNYFHNFSGIKEMVFPDGLVYVQPFAIINCSVEKLVFKKNLEQIYFENFRSNKNLKCIEIEDGGDFYTSIKGNVYSADKTCLVYGVNDTIADTTTKIGEKAFMNSKIESINFPESILTIEADAFFSCEQLHDVRFNGDNLVRIGESAFEKCSSLKRIKIPKSVRTIDFSAFRDTSLEELLFEDRTESGPELRINVSAFMNTNLNVIDFSKIPYLIIEEEAFMGANTKSLYFVGNFYIESHAFSGCNIESIALKSIDIDISTLKIVREPLGKNSLALIELMSRHNNRNDSTSYILYNNAWIDDLYW